MTIKTSCLLIVVAFMLGSCEKETDDYANMLELSYTLENYEIIQGTPNTLTIHVENISDRGISPEGAVGLEFCLEGEEEGVFVNLNSYDGEESYKWFPKIRMQFEGKEMLTQTIDIEKILWDEDYPDGRRVAPGDYSVRLVLKLSNNPRVPGFTEPVKSPGLSVKLN